MKWNRKPAADRTGDDADFEGEPDEYELDEDEYDGNGEEEVFDDTASSDDGDTWEDDDGDTWDADAEDDAGTSEAEASDEQVVEEASGKRRSGAGRAADSRKRPPMSRQRPAIPSGASQPVKGEMATKWAIDRLDLREKRLTFAAAGAAALFGIAIYFTETNNPKFRLAKGQLTPQTTLIIGLVAAALLIATAFLGRRAPVGFVAFFTGAGLQGSSLLLGLPFMAFALWLLYRSFKIQRKAAAEAKAMGLSPPGSRRAASRPERGARGTKSKNAPPPGPRRPQANKRYTPKRPPPGTPAPRRSRRS